MYRLALERTGAAQQLQVGIVLVARGRRRMRVDQVEREAEQLLARIAVHHAGGRVAVDDRPVATRVIGIDQHDSIRRMLEEETKRSIAGEQIARILTHGAYCTRSIQE